MLIEQIMNNWRTLGTIIVKLYAEKCFILGKPRIRRSVVASSLYPLNVSMLVISTSKAPRAFKTCNIIMETRSCASPLSWIENKISIGLFLSLRLCTHMVCIISENKLHGIPIPVYTLRMGLSKHQTPSHKPFEQPFNPCWSYFRTYTWTRA